MGLEDQIGSIVTWGAPGVDLSDTARTALKTMAKSRSSAAAVQLDGEVVGVVTDMDFMGCIARGEDLDGVRVVDFMSPCAIITNRTIMTPCVQLDESQSVENAIGVMDLAGIHHLLVTGDNGASVVSAGDLLRLVVGRRRR